MAARSQPTIINVAPRNAHLATANAFHQNGNHVNRETDGVRHPDDVGTNSLQTVHIYDELNLAAAQTETDQSQYAPLSTSQIGDAIDIYTKLDSLEQNQQRLAAQFELSQKQILSELSQIREMVSSLSAQVKTSLTSAQKMSTEQQQCVQEMAANLGQEVFQVGQEVMETIREKNNEDLARQAWWQEMQTHRLTSERSKNSKKNALPSL